MYFQLKKVPNLFFENKIEQLEKQGLFLNSHCTIISCAVVSDDLKYLVTGSGSSRNSDDCSIRIWDLTTSQQVFNIKHLPKRVTHISISPDNSFVFATLESTSLFYAELWSSLSIKYLLESQSKIIIISVLSNDHGLFLTHEGKFLLLNFHTREILLIIYYEQETNIECMALKRNCFAFGTSTGVLNVCYFDKSFVSEPFPVCKGRIKGIHFDNEGKFLMFTAQKTTKESRIFIWDIEAKCVVRKIKLEGLNDTKICFSNQLNILVAKFYDSIRIYDFNNGSGFATINLDSVCDFFIVKDFLIVIMTGIYNYKNRIAVYNIQNKDFYDFDGHIGVVTCIKTAKGMNFLASSSLDGKIFLWDLKSKKVIRKFLGHTEGVISLDFDDNHVYVVSGSLDKSCRIWDFNTGNTVGVIGGNANWVTDVKVAPNCQFVIFACCSSNVINVYDIEKSKSRVMNLIENFCIKSIGIQGYCKYAVCGTGYKILVLKL